jgi:RecA-family ATPase
MNNLNFKEQILNGENLISNLELEKEDALRKLKDLQN